MSQNAPVDFDGKVQIVRTPKGELHVLLQPKGDPINRPIKITPRERSDSEKRIATSLLRSQMQNVSPIRFNDGVHGLVMLDDDGTVKISFMARHAGNEFFVESSLTAGPHLEYSYFYRNLGQNLDIGTQSFPLGSGDLDFLVDLAVKDMITALQSKVPELARLKLVGAQAAPTVEMVKARALDEDDVITIPKGTPGRWLQHEGISHFISSGTFDTNDDFDATVVAVNIEGQKIVVEVAATKLTQRLAVTFSPNQEISRKTV